MRFLFLLVFTFALQPVSKAQNFSKVDSFVDYLRQNEQFMGAISLKNGSATPVTYVGGFSSVESRAAVNTKTTFRIGSITKMFTSVMIHQLWEEGKLDLTDKLSMYFPEFPGGENITLSNLLYHQSGIHNFTDEQEYVAYMTEPKTHEEMLAIMMKYPADFEPGADSKYSNSNYVLLGYIIEQVTGSSYKEQLEQRIVKPLGLKQTKAGFPGNSESEEAYSYIDASVKWMPSPVTDLSIPHGAGMIVSTPSDLCIFIEGLFKGKLLADSTVDEMTRLRGRYGKGIFFIPFYEHKAYGHTGGIDGFVSSLAYFPKDSLAIAICLNGMRYAPNDIALGVLSSYFDKELEYPDFTKKLAELTEAQLNRCAGKYTSSNFPLDISVVIKQGVMFAEAKGQTAFPLEAHSEAVFRFDPAGILMEFKPSADGKTMTGFKLTQMGASYDFLKE